MKGMGRKNIRIENGAEVERRLGWQREEWEATSGIDGLGPGLPDWRPGCGSLSVDPARVSDLAVRFGGEVLRARRIELADAEDEIEAMFARGWSDGLPLVPPTEARVLAMLEGTKRAPDDVVAVVPLTVVVALPINATAKTRFGKELFLDPPLATQLELGFEDVDLSG